MIEDQTLKKFKDAFDLNIAVHLIECATLDEAREKAKQLVFIYKNNNQSSASSVLIHTQLNDKKEIQEHELAGVEKVDKQCNTSEKAHGGGQQSHNKQHPMQHHGHSPTHGGQGHIKQRGRFNYRGNNQRGRGYYQNDQRQSFRGRGYRRGCGFDQYQDNYRSNYQCGRP